MTSRDKIKDMIKGHEGYKGEVYLDTENVATCGWGHALHVGSKIPIEVSEILFKYDFKRAENAATAIELDNGLNLNEVRHAVLTDMAFNMGYAGVCKFKKFIAAMSVEDWALAAAEMLDSKWAKQVGVRAKYLATLMVKGVWI